MFTERFQRESTKGSRNRGREWVQINTDNDAHQLDPIIRAKRD